MTLCILGYTIAYMHNGFAPFAKIILVAILVLCFIDYILLFITSKKINCTRNSSSLLSNGDANELYIHIQNNYPFIVHANIIDEIPFQFQQRDFLITKKIAPNSAIQFSYTLTPHERGEFEFGHLLVYCSTGIGIFERRYTNETTHTVHVYPSFIKLREYEIAGMFNNQLGEHNFKKRGASTEFDHIKEYNRGDDARTINWKASARKNNLMINSYVDEKAQQVYCIIDKGRIMKMPFDNLTLLDYAINATQMLSFVAMQKKDKVGIITFSEKVNDVLLASKNKKQFNEITQLLYKQKTQFLESNYADMFQTCRKVLGQRSLLLFFTNIETLSALERKLPYLKALQQKNMLCVILFENTEIQHIHTTRANTIEDVYVKTIADKYSFEKRTIVKELQKNGILTIYTTPKKLTVEVINKYLSIKSKRLL